MNGKENIPEISPEELAKVDKILDYEIKQMELEKGKAQIRVLKLTIIGGFLAVIRFGLEYGQEWVKILTGGK